MCPPLPSWHSSSRGVYAVSRPPTQHYSSQAAPGRCSRPRAVAGRARGGGGKCRQPRRAQASAAGPRRAVPRGGAGGTPGSRARRCGGEGGGGRRRRDAPPQPQPPGEWGRGKSSFIIFRYSFLPFIGFIFPGWGVGGIVACEAGGTHTGRIPRRAPGPLPQRALAKPPGEASGGGGVGAALAAAPQEKLPLVPQRKPYFKFFSSPQKIA